MVFRLRKLQMMRPASTGYSVGILVSRDASKHLAESFLEFETLQRMQYLRFRINLPPQHERIITFDSMQISHPFSRSTKRVQILRHKFFLFAPEIRSTLSRDPTNESKIDKPFTFSRIALFPSTPSFPIANERNIPLVRFPTSRRIVSDWLIIATRFNRSSMQEV